MLLTQKGSVFRWLLWMQVVYAASDVVVTLDILTELVLIRMNQLEHSQREGCSVDI